MRVAYVAPYQGPSLCRARPVVGNLSLAGSMKVELIAGLLKDKRHEVEIVSQGEVIELGCKWYPSIAEEEPFDLDIAIHYASALPIRYINGLWSARKTLDLLKSRHRQAPFDLVIVYNLKRPQMVSADYAIHQLGLPVIFEYEDDSFVDLYGKLSKGSPYANLLARFDGAGDGILEKMSGCLGVSPHLLSQLPPHIPKLLLRGVVGKDIIESSKLMTEGKRNWVLFSGTFHKVKGIEQLIQAWELLQPPGWELHITGHGGLASRLAEMAEKVRGVVLHGLVRREELVRLMCSAKICINPHALSETPGNVFAFKIIEYIAAGAHVVSTPMGVLEGEIERGITYIGANDPRTIATTLNEVILGSAWRQTAAEYVCAAYGPGAISDALDEFLLQAVEYHRAQKKAKA